MQITAKSWCGRFGPVLAKGLAAFALGAAVSPSFALEEIRAAYFDLPPHTHTVDSTQPSGAALGYFELIAKEMKLSPCYETQPLSRVVLGQQADIVLLLAKTPEREKVLRYATAPQIAIHGALALPRSSAIDKISSAAELNALHLAAWGNGYRSPMLANPQLPMQNLFGANVLERGLELVKLGRVDAFYSPDAMAMKFVIERHNWAGDLKIVPLAEPEVGLFSAFSTAGDAKFRARFEQAFERVSRKLSYASYLQSYATTAGVAVNRTYRPCQ